MKATEDKGCLNFGAASSQENSASGSSSTTSFDFHKETSKTRSFHRQTGLGKPTPSKWDDAQKWIVNLSRGGEKKHSQTTPRNSNADDRRLIAPVPKTEEEWSGEEEVVSSCYMDPSSNGLHSEMESEKMDCDEPTWRINKPSKGPSASVVRSISVRDMGTEMTPTASQEPSRAATPLKATTPATRSPISSGCSTPIKHHNGLIPTENGQISALSAENRSEVSRGNETATRFSQVGEELHITDNSEKQNSHQTSNKQSPLEVRAMAWDEAERAKYMARYKREEVKIQAWENHEKRKAEMEMRRMEVKAERLKSRAQEKFSNKLAYTRRKAEEKRANAEAKLNEKAVETSERADYIRRNGHLPSSFSFKMPSFCW